MDAETLSNWRKAANLYEKVVAHIERYSGPASTDALAHRDNWAVCLRYGGQIVAAISCNREAISQYERSMGPRHKLTLEALGRLAENYLVVERYGDATREYELIRNRLKITAADPLIICQNARYLAVALYRSDTPHNIMKAVNINVDTIAFAEKALATNSIETFRMRYELGI